MNVKERSNDASMRSSLPYRTYCVQTYAIPFGKRRIRFGAFPYMPHIVVRQLASSAQLPAKHIASVQDVLSRPVHHSRFSTALLALSPSMWFTCGLPSSFGMNASATSLWMHFVSVAPMLLDSTLRSLLCRAIPPSHAPSPPCVASQRASYHVLRKEVK